jgi:alkylation response protein AidB-like acyl-CoA dehydrogenase
MTMTSVQRALLTDEMLARFDERAPIYDRENRFFDEDFEELVASGYTKLAIPVELGGAGLALDEYSKLATQLGYVAPATALALNMHIYWTGIAADLLKMGDDSWMWLLEKAADGEIFAALHGEAGNDFPAVFSTTQATRVDGGWEITGHKIFGTLSPVWTYGGFHAQDNSDPDNPKIVHGFLARGTAGVEIVDTWDTLGMRATQSQDTLLDKAFCPDELVVSVGPAGLASGPAFLGPLFAWGLLGMTSVYYGAAKRAFDITVARIPQKSSVANMQHSMAYHPEVQHHVADMRMSLDICEALLRANTTDWAQGVEHADWPIRLVGTRFNVVNHAYDVVEKALDLSGGAAAFKRNRLEQIFRDVRMGRFHPGNSFLAHELIGKLSLGVNPDDTQRWG